MRYLREDNLDKSSDQSEQSDRAIVSDEHAESDVQQEYLTVNNKGRQVRRSTIFLAVLFCCGILSLFFMIKKSGPGAVEAGDGKMKMEEIQIEKALARLGAGKSDTFEKVGKLVDRFYEFSNMRQVEVSELKKDPFKIDRFSGDFEAEYDGVEIEINSELMRRYRLAEQIKSLELLSIMQPDEIDVNMWCMINGKILREGDSIKSFKVCKIKADSVELECEGLEVVLKLGGK